MAATPHGLARLSPDTGRTVDISAASELCHKRTFLGALIAPTKHRTQREAGDMMMKSTHDSPILVTGAAGATGAIGRNLTAMLLAKGHQVRALVRREDERAGALRRLGAEVVQGDLTDLASMHRAIEGCARIYFGMSVSPAYLEATVNTAAVARHHGVEAFVNMSQMTVTQMSITETTDSPQHKLHWLAEQALSWSGLPIVTVRPTVFVEGFFLLLAAASVRDANELALQQDLARLVG
jgi:uncharacterized protein YbjT (DUF2867 family)